MILVYFAYQFNITYINKFGGGGVQLTCQPTKIDPTQWVGIGLQKDFDSGLGWILVIKFKTRQT